MEYWIDIRRMYSIEIMLYNLYYYIQLCLLNWPPTVARRLGYGRTSGLQLVTIMTLERVWISHPVFYNREQSSVKVAYRRYRPWWKYTSIMGIVYPVYIQQKSVAPAEIDFDFWNAKSVLAIQVYIVPSAVSAVSTVKAVSTISWKWNMVYADCVMCVVCSHV